VSNLQDIVYKFLWPVVVILLGLFIGGRYIVQIASRPAPPVQVETLPGQIIFVGDHRMMCTGCYAATYSIDQNGQDNFFDVPRGESVRDLIPSPLGTYVVHDYGSQLDFYDRNGRHLTTINGANPTWSPDESNFVLTSDSDTILYRYDYLAASPIELARYDTRISSLKWSPNNSYLAYTVRDVGTFLLNTTDYQSELLIQSGYNLNWLPDSEWLAFEQYSSYYQINVLSKEIISTELPLDATIWWSPDYSHFLAYEHTEGIRIYAYNTIPVLIYENLEPYTKRLSARPFGQFRWSPDSKSVAFVMDKDCYMVSDEDMEDCIISSDQDTSELYVIDIAYRSLQSLTDIERQIREIAWSPDSSQIAFIAKESPYRTKEIYIVNVTTKEVQWLQSPGAGDTISLENLIWLPESK
jgi:Tol biopolymer transport system component